MKKKLKVKKKLGRNTKYNPNIHNNLVYEYIKKGLDNKSIAEDVLNISEAVFYEWLKQFPEFQESYNKGKKESDIKNLGRPPKYTFFSVYKDVLEMRKRLEGKIYLSINKLYLEFGYSKSGFYRLINKFTSEDWKKANPKYKEFSEYLWDLKEQIQDYVDKNILEGGLLGKLDTSAIRNIRGDIVKTNVQHEGEININSRYEKYKNLSKEELQQRKQELLEKLKNY